MLEELCRDSFYNACHEIVTKDRLCFKGEIRSRKYQDFFGSDGLLRFNWKVVPLAYLTGRGANGAKRKNGRKAWFWFNEHEDQIRDHYLRVRYGGKENIANAMNAFGDFDALFADFCLYFSERREQFLKSTENALEKRNKDILATGRHPQSHGGVANLLKVLTKTMHDQGNSIYTIAKVQYSICIQAGIYIPDEFLTDVLVAGEMIQED